MKHNPTLVPFLLVALAGACASSRGDSSRAASANDTNAWTERRPDDVAAQQPGDPPSYPTDRRPYPADDPAYTNERPQYPAHAPYNVEITGGDQHRLPAYALNGRTYVLGAIG